MFKTLTQRLLLRVFANRKVRALFEQDLLARDAERLIAAPRLRALYERDAPRTPPVPSNPQLTFAPPGDYYSPLPDVAALEEKLGRLGEPAPGDDGVELRTAEQLRLVEQLDAAAPFDWPQSQAPGRRYWVANDFYSGCDAVALHAMMCHYRPRRVIEVGSGFSSALMLDTNEQHLGGATHLTFIEPYPDRLRRLLRPADESAARLVVCPVQDVPLGTFDALDHDDILFIDSSHVAKAGSDLNHLLFAVLPRLRPGVIVHFHDIFYPFEYPLCWLREGRAWNEAYVLRAFLQYNHSFAVLLFNSYLASRHREAVCRRLPRWPADGAACSLWLRKLG